MQEMVGASIRKARESKGWSRATLSQKAGVGSTTIAQVELYGRIPRLSTLRLLTKALGLRLADVLEDAA